MATKCRVKIGKITSIRIALAFQNGLQYRQSDFKKLIYDDVATSCKNLMWSSNSGV